MRDTLLCSTASMVVYLSCSLTTLARDLIALSSQFQLESVTLLDLFPQTTHLESLAILRRTTNKLSGH